MKLYVNDFSNAPLRVRIALAIKGVRVEEVHVDLDRVPGEQHSEHFRAVNPQRLIPVLVDGGVVIRQSLAIVEYLEEKRPLPALLPGDAAARARVRSLALIVACEGQPLLNLRVREYLGSEMGLSSALASRWFRHWMEGSLAEYESCLAIDGHAARFSYGPSPTVADVFLVPHVLMAHRFRVDTSRYPLLSGIFERCLEREDFLSAVGSALDVVSPGATG